MRNNKLLALLLPLLLLVSCGTNNANVVKGFMNNKHQLVRVADIHDAGPNDGIRLDWIEGAVPYSNLFNLNESYIDFKCEGTSYEDFHGEATFKLVDCEDNVIVYESFCCHYEGGQGGLVVYDTDSVKEKLGTIYVSVIYRCRWQMEYDVGEGKMVLLTFEFWKGEFNPLPSFLENQNE